MIIDNNRWLELLSGETAVRCTEAIDGIVRDLQASHVSPMDWGEALLHVYLSRTTTFDSHSHKDRALILIDRAVDAMAHSVMPPSLYRGFAGVGWLVAHSERQLGLLADGAHEDIQRTLLQSNAISVGRDYDLINGPVGMAVYFLECLPHQTADEGLMRIVDALQRACITNGDQVTWHTPPELLPEWQRRIAPNGYFNLGVAHGVPGVIGVLAEIHRYRRSAATAQLLDGAIRWVLAQQHTDGTFPTWTAEGSPSQPSRLAWCYGELGLSVCLLNGSVALGSDELVEKAIGIALLAARRRAEHGVVDASLCHGSAGNGHLFNRLFQATQREEFRDAAIFWFNRALDMRNSTTGSIGGYVSWLGTPRSGSQRGGWTSDSSFLTGASGIALAFLAAITRVEPLWDSVLLSSLRPTSGLWSKSLA